MVLLELIFSIVLFSIIALITTNIGLNLYKKNQTKTYQTFTNLKLETTRLFLIKNRLVDISLSGGSLYFKTNLLLENISTYNISNSGTIATVDICIDDDKICQEWKIKL